MTERKCNVFLYFMLWEWGKTQNNCKTQQVKQAEVSFSKTQKTAMQRIAIFLDFLHQTLAIYVNKKLVLINVKFMIF